MVRPSAAGAEAGPAPRLCGSSMTRLFRMRIFADHQQPQVADDVRREHVVGDVVAIYVEAETLALDSASVGEVDLEVELHAMVHASLRQ